MRKVCKEGEVLNPKTNRCVKKTGKIGKALVEKQPVAKTTGGIYIPAYLLQQEEKTLPEYLSGQNPGTPPTTLRLMKRFLDILLTDILDTTRGCAWHYRREKKLRREDIVHTLQMLGVAHGNRKEDKEFTDLLRPLIPQPFEPTVPGTLSRALLPFTTQPPQPPFQDTLAKVRPSTPLERLYLRSL
jgi:hypothetical protein